MLFTMKWTCITDSHSSNISPFYQTDSVKYQLNVLGSQHLDKLPPRPFGFYAITRFNPLFKEEPETGIEKTSNSTPTDTIKYEVKRDLSKYLHKSALCEDSFTVLEQNSDFIRRVLVSVRLGGRYHRQASSNGLPPIPEGKIDVIPRPIWPPENERFQKKGDDVAVKDNPQTNFRQLRKSETLYVGRKSSLSEMLREISDGSPINVKMSSVESAADLSGKIVLQSLHGKVDDCEKDSSLIRTLPGTNMVGDDQAAMLNSALRLVEKYYERSPNIMGKKYQSFQRSGMFNTHSSSHSYYGPTSGSSSSSSVTSISGFSDLTQTPSSNSSSSSQFPTASRIIHKNKDFTRALHNERVHRNGLVELNDEALACGNACCNGASSNVKKSVSFSTFQCHIVPINHTGYSATQSASPAIVAQFERTEITNSVDDIKSDSQLSSFPGRRCPDFTLDVHQAEKVTKEIKDKEKERCWCRILTSCAGFVLLLFSVMFFSMMLTRGERIFGSL